METTTIRCRTCKGSGEVWWSSMGPADNMDIDGGIEDCENCLGTGWENIEIEFTADQVAA